MSDIGKKFNPIYDPMSDSAARYRRCSDIRLSQISRIRDIMVICAIPAYRGNARSHDQPGLGPAGLPLLPHISYSPDMEPDDLAFYPKAKMNVAGATISGMIL
jgi:hypothetical protein